MSLQLGSPYSQTEISEALTAEVTAVYNFFESMAADLFFSAPEGVWTPADNLVHLIKSVSPVLRALTIPRIVLRGRFGTTKRPSQTLAEIRDVYVNKALAGGGVASGSFLPEVETTSATERERILSKWLHKGEEFPHALAGWSEVDLDKYLLPHPLLGDMTVREILFFTLYHNMHHVNDVQRLRHEPVSEWFEMVPASLDP
jgi:hypothetical protein